LPLPLLFGWLTDRTDRKRLLIACFLAPVLGLLVQLGASSPWQFWVGSLLSSVVGVSLVVGSAMVTDQFPPSHLDAALSWLNATAWIGIVLGLSVGGLAIQAVQMTSTLLAGVLVGASAMALLVLIHGPLGPPGRTQGTTRGLAGSGTIGLAMPGDPE
jgi:MFS family permease